MSFSFPTNCRRSALWTCALLFFIGGWNAMPALADDPHTLRLAPVIIRDPMINNVEALRFLAPVGWKVEGGITWHHDTWLLASLSMHLSDPASRASITIFPADTFMWSQAALQITQGVAGSRYMGSLVIQLPNNTPEVITRVLVPALRPPLVNAKVTATENLPAMAQMILQQNQEAGINKTCQASRVRYAYNDPDGTAMEEDIYAVVITTPMPQLQMMSWHLERSYSVRAERGKLDAMTRLLTTMIISSRFGEDWVAGYQYVVQLRNQNNMQAIADAGAISRYIAQNAEEMRRMNRESFEKSQRVQDDCARAVSQSIRGVEDYKLPGENGRIELPAGYTGAWYDKNANEYVLSETPLFDPNVIPNHTWTPIEKSRP